MEEKEGSRIGRREKLGCGAGTRSQPTPQGSLEQEWPFRVLPHLQEGGRGLSISAPGDEGCPHQARDLGQEGTFSTRLQLPERH